MILFASEVCWQVCLNCGYLFRWFQIELARDVGYAAARFGHVMFPENVYEPALECAELLLEGVGKGLILFFSLSKIFMVKFLHPILSLQV